MSAQTDLDEKKRKKMPLGAMIAKAGKIPGKRVVLVDDVCTTGTTLLRAASGIEGAGGRVAAAVTWSWSPKALH